MVGPQPDAAMMAPVETVARFIATGDAALLGGVFASPEVTIVENFAPFLFEGAWAVAEWTTAMRAHAHGLADLSHTFGRAQDFAADRERAFFSLPTTWRGISRGRPFVETGGWAFVLVWQEDAWRIRAYGWAVTGLRAAAAGKK